jgi:hypothetical protein
MRPTDGDFERFLDEVVALGDEADAPDDCVCPACLAGRLDDLMEMQRLLQGDVSQMLTKLDQITERLASK